MTSQPCRDLCSQLSDYLDGELASRACAEIERHLATCEACRIVVDTLNKTNQLYQKLPPSEAPADVQERLVRVLKLSRL
jgi:anti-sigma factor RsiW